MILPVSEQDRLHNKSTRSYYYLQTLDPAAQAWASQLWPQKQSQVSRRLCYAKEKASTRRSRFCNFYFQNDVCQILFLLPILRHGNLLLDLLKLFWVWYVDVLEIVLETLDVGRDRQEF